ncbi:glr1705 [Gloeobacter violaceus PCC 7421]|uniref:Glr1705 protein n=1 Tax=Gloeobacter violaceus (strain ATCC 29082 / PCC 7421) TaxID=251221 RepID=Q7NJX6_GLOVI|nr:glr1705 [Gloeobacter violaceus PCC 7421]
MAVDNSGRHYDEEQLAAILKRAVQLQQQSGSSDSHLSLGEIEQIAREAGIDPSFVRQAASELAAGGGRDAPASPLGGPSALAFEQSIAGILVGDDFDPLLEEIRSAFADPGHLEGPRSIDRPWRFEWRLFNWGGVSLQTGKQSPITRSLTWRSSQASMREIGVRVYSLGGATVVRVEEQLGNAAVGLLTGMMTLPIFLIFPLTLLLTHSAAIALAATALSALGAYWLARGFYRAVTQKRSRQLRQLFDRLVLQVRQTLGIA